MVGAFTVTTWGPQFLIDTTNTGWILLPGQNRIPLLGHQWGLFHGHGHKGANTALEQLAEAREKGDHAAIFLHEKNLAFHLGGHVNHSIWWKNLSPQGGDKPVGELAAAIDDAFGSFDRFRAQFAAAANGLQGSGWAVLGYDTLGSNLLTFQLYDQQANVPLGIIPLLQVDMWEHAYYLQYKNVKADYVTAFWNVVNWPDVQDRFAAATTKAPGVIF